MSIYDKASLVLIPSGTKTSKVYSQKPVNGDGDFTFSRSTAATRVNADGNIEKETQNLLLQSNNFGNGGYWNDVAVSVTGGQAGYDGTNDAFLITKQSSSFARLQQNLSLSGVVTMSAYLKAGTESLSTFRLGISDYAVQFRLDNQTILDTGNIAAIDTGIEDVGSGWYRCHATWNVASTSVVQYYVGWNVSDSKNLYIQDAQVEYGLVARDYIETTTAAVEGGITDNVPRLDYTDSSCPALLLEPQRTNLVPQSEYFEGYSKVGTITITSNYGISPEGVQNSTRVQFSGASNELLTSTTASAGNVSTIYIKGTSGETIKFGSNGAEELFTLNGDWQRLEKYNAGAATKITLNTYSGATARDVEVWGAMQEQGSYATSYIPTYGSAVTRNADDTTITNLQSNNIAGDTFSYFFEWGDYVAERNFEIRDSSNNLTLFMVSRLFRYYQDDGSVDTLLTLPTSGTSLKCMVTYDGTTLKGFVNGTADGSVTDADADKFSDVNKIRLDRDMDDKEELRSLMIFPTALTDQEAIDLTTL